MRLMLEAPKNLDVKKYCEIAGRILAHRFKYDKEYSGLEYVEYWLSDAPEYTTRDTVLYELDSSCVDIRLMETFDELNQLFGVEVDIYTDSGEGEFEYSDAGIWEYIDDTSIFNLCREGRDKITA